MNLLGNDKRAMYILDREFESILHGNGKREEDDTGTMAALGDSKSI